MTAQLQQLAMTLTERARSSSSPPSLPPPTGSDLTTLTRFDDRKLRAIASESEGQIISGHRGYRLTRAATIEEIDRCTATLRSQADSMTARALQIARVYHGHKAIRP